jgi:hypothetical protein
VNEDPVLKDYPRPEGIFDFGQAKREIESDRSDARKQALRTYIESYRARDSVLTAELNSKLREESKKDDVPRGAKDLAEARAQADDLDVRLNFRYIPPGHEEELGPLVKTIEYLTAKKEQAVLGVRAIPGVSEAQPKRSELERAEREGGVELRRLLVRWEKLWKDGLVTSPKVAEMTEESKLRLELFERLYIEYKNDTVDWMRDMDATGQTTAARLQQMPPNLIAMRAGQGDAKRTYVELRDAIPSVRIVDGLTGQLQPGPKADGAVDPVKEATDIVQKLYGQSGTNPSPESAIAQQADRQKRLNEMLRYYSILEQSLNRMIWEYVQTMNRLGYSTPVNVTRVSIGDELDLPYPDLVKKLSEDPVIYTAFEATMKIASPFLSQLRALAQSEP